MIDLSNVSKVAKLSGIRIAVLIVFVLMVCTNYAQNKRPKKYTSLFWEITGNGLKKPSYLFGTMHVSSKMVFHLSDSFYHAIKSTDAVALELNPEIWQDQMFKMQNAQMALARFSTTKLDDYLNEQSFQLTGYEDNIKSALSDEPTVVNNLLYRSYQARADFEENTYLDLYIYQTGRKLGKSAAGVENYLETERLMLEAYQDMAKEKNRQEIDTDGESMYDIQRKIQEAYRQGDLDLMDSLDKLTTTSPAFNEKFLYRRNEIQAHSIDTILKKRSLFVGVGAAHLPGERGVIELLRKKGYKLRPIYMQNRDAVKKDEIDKLRVPATFNSVSTDDGFIQFKIPGKLYKREETRDNDSWQYADMNNGSYYMLTRVRNHGAILGQTTKEVLRKTDSLLYENIPGKIIKKLPIVKSGFQGYDIVNRTRRGDLQRYQVLVTPFEVLVFKMGGNDDYIQGKEAELFFSSIKIRQAVAKGWTTYQPPQGGFSVELPQEPNVNFNKKNTDQIARWEYEAVDSATGNAYMVWKKTINNIGFIEEDTFDISLMEESLKKSEIIEKQLSRKWIKADGTNGVQMDFILNNGQYLKAKAFVRGPHYYIVAARTQSAGQISDTFFNSFRFTPFHYPAPESFTDTAMKFTVQTSVNPSLDTALQGWMNKAMDDVSLSPGQFGDNYWPTPKSALFKSDSTGEAIVVSVQTFPKYYYSRDTTRFWNDQLNLDEAAADFNITQKTAVHYNDSTSGYEVHLTDTNSARMIKKRYILQGNRLYQFETVSDTSANQSAFANTFFNTFTPLKSPPVSIFASKLATFTNDYLSKDSLTSKKAKAATSNIYFGKEGVDWLAKTINELKFGDKDYFEQKSSLIAELGYVDDSTSTKKIVDILKDIYKKTADTSFFQNPALLSLARLKTVRSFAAVKEIMLQDPPVFENRYQYANLFEQFEDTLALARQLFPEILNLASVDDYKIPVNDLLVQLVDSGYLTAKDYKPFFSKIYFDAKIHLKKQQNKDELQLEQESKQDDEAEGNRRRNNRSYNSRSLIDDYALLLIPFYNDNPDIPPFFQKLLLSKDLKVKMNAAVMMLRYNKKVPDSVLLQVASSDLYRADLLEKLEKIDKASYFPAQYKNQADIAKSLLLNSEEAEKFADIVLVDTFYLSSGKQKGHVYFFKYKLKKEEEWKMGISGGQPADTTKVSSTSELVTMTNRKLKAEESISTQYQSQLHRLLLASRRSSRDFFDDDDNISMFSSRYRDFDNED